MTDTHEKGPKKAARVSEAVPVQVFLGYQDHALLQRLAAQLNATKSEVLRRSLAALERMLLNPDTHPALRMIGLASDDGLAGNVDVARDHDRVLAAQYEYAPRRAARKPRGKA